MDKISNLFPYLIIIIYNNMSLLFLIQLGYLKDSKYFYFISSLLCKLNSLLSPPFKTFVIKLNSF